MSTMRAIVLMLMVGVAFAAQAPIPASNDVSLREYVDIRFKAQEEAVNAALAAADRAVAKAESAADKRFESVNEFRASLNDQARMLMPRAEAEQLQRTLNEKLDAQNAKVDALTVRVSANEDRGKGVSATWILLIALIGVLTSVGSLLLTFSRNPKKVEHFEHQKEPRT
jgi:hypothetical protein